MRVLVTGGRDHPDRRRVFQALDKFHAKHGPITLVIHGGARGADASAHAWARSRRVNYRECPADWDTHGRAAGPIRNRQMLVDHKPNVVIAFPGGNGTQDMVDQATAAGVKVYEVDRKPKGVG